MKYRHFSHLYVLLAVSTVIAAGSAHATEPSTLIKSGQMPLEQSQGSSPVAEQLSQRGTQTEVDTFFESDYTYWDAAQLADYWGQSLIEAKARIGRKVLWGPADVAILEQFLLDARLDPLQTLEETQNLRFYSESDYSYADAVALAEFWGDASPYEAKLRIERNLIMGNADEVATALQLATQ
jgi:hypothetical protein